MSYLENQISDIFLNDEGRVIKTKDFLRLCLHKWYYFPLLFYHLYEYCGVVFVADT